MSLFFVFPNISNEETGEKFRECREAVHMSQQEVADLLYVTAQAVSKWETGKSLPNIENLAALMVLYHKGFNDLIVLKNGTGENRSHSFSLSAMQTESLSACRIAGHGTRQYGRLFLYRYGNSGLTEIFCLFWRQKREDPRHLWQEIPIRRYGFSGRRRMIRHFSFGISRSGRNCIKPLVDCLSKSSNDMLNTRKGDCRKKGGRIRAAADSKR